MLKVNTIIIAIVIVLSLLFFTLARNSVWHSARSIWTDSIEKQRAKKPRALLNLANAYKENEEYQKAEECYGAVLQIAPYYHQARFFRAVMLIKLERYEEALKELEAIEYFYKNVLPFFPEKKKFVDRYFREDDLYNAINELKKRSFH